MTLTEWMARTGDSPAEVSRGSGVPKSTLSRFLKGRSPFDAENIERLISYSKRAISFDELMAEARQRMEWRKTKRWDLLKIERRKADAEARP